MEVAEELRKALAVKNREGAEKDAEIARLQKRCALLDGYPAVKRWILRAASSMSKR